MTPSLGVAVTQPGYEDRDGVARGRLVNVQESVVSATEHSPGNGAAVARPRPAHRTERRARLRQLVLVIEPNPAVDALLRGALGGCGLDVLTMSSLPHESVPHELSADAVLVNEEQLGGDPSAIEAFRFAGRCPLIVYRARRTGSKTVFFFDPLAAPCEPLGAQALGRRVRARIRPLSPAPTGNTIEAGPLRVDPAGHRVYVSGVEVVLTALEFRLLVAILSAGGHVLSRETLLNEVWGIRRDVDTRTVDAHVKRLRRKLGEGGKMIETVRGFGYRVTGLAASALSSAG
jgi:DNA-binding response OmpR family regulator